MCSACADPSVANQISCAGVKPLLHATCRFHIAAIVRSIKMTTTAGIGRQTSAPSPA
jgi:hypothetical protein